MSRFASFQRSHEPNEEVATKVSSGADVGSDIPDSSSNVVEGNSNDLLAGELASATVNMDDSFGKYCNNYNDADHHEYDLGNLTSMPPPTPAMGRFFDDNGGEICSVASSEDNGEMTDYAVLVRSSKKFRPTSTAEVLHREDSIENPTKDDSHHPREVNIVAPRDVTDLPPPENIDTPPTKYDNHHTSELSHHIINVIARQPKTNLASTSTEGDQNNLFGSGLTTDNETLTASIYDDSERDGPFDVVPTSKNQGTLDLELKALPSNETEYQESSVSHHLHGLNRSGTTDRPRDEQDDAIFNNDDQSNHQYNRPFNPVSKLHITQFRTDGIQGNKRSKYDDKQMLRYRQQYADGESDGEGNFQTPKQNVRVRFFGHNNNEKASTITPLTSQQGTVTQSSSTSSVPSAPKSILRSTKDDEDVMDVKEPIPHGVKGNTNTARPTKETLHVLHVPHDKSVGWVAVTPGNTSNSTQESDAGTRSYQQANHSMEEQHPVKNSRTSGSDGSDPYTEDTDRYEYHQAKFLNEICDTQDLQEKNATKILGMEYMLAPNLATILNYRASFLDLLDKAEAADAMADETLQGFQDFSEHWDNIM
jgi:hypothetical protein